MTELEEFRAKRSILGRVTSIPDAAKTEAVLCAPTRPTLNAINRLRVTCSRPLRPGPFTKRGGAFSSSLPPFHDRFRICFDPGTAAPTGK